jgi:hypothetical protein
VFAYDWLAHGETAADQFEQATRERPSNGIIQVPEE